ncbi:MAG: Zn-ribbon domain-containing OB-fold protein [Acidimicrobiales bacterium]
MTPALSQPMLCRPALVNTTTSAPFWDAARSGRLLLQHCVSCGHMQHYPRTLCTACWSEVLEWTVSAGVGSVWTCTVVHHPGHPAWRSETPYTLAIVELDEGPRLLTNVVGVSPDRVMPGQRVRLVEGDLEVLRVGGPPILPFELDVVGGYGDSDQ